MDFDFSPGEYSLFGAAKFTIKKGEAILNGYSMHVSYTDTFYIPIYAAPLPLICSTPVTISFEAVEILHKEMSMYPPAIQNYSKICDNVFYAKGIYTHFPQNLLEIVNLIDPSRPKTICVLGNKGTGKSTFCRYIVNVLLSKFNQISYINLDPGQPEFGGPQAYSKYYVKAPMIRSPEHSLSPGIVKAHSYFINSTTPNFKINSDLNAILSTCNHQEMTIINFPGMFDKFSFFINSIIQIVNPDYIFALSNQEINTTEIPNLQVGIVNSYDRQIVSKPKTLRMLRYTSSFSSDEICLPTTHFRIIRDSSSLDCSAMNIIVALCRDTRPCKYHQNDLFVLVDPLESVIDFIGYACITRIDQNDKKIYLKTTCNVKESNLIIFPNVL